MANISFAMISLVGVGLLLLFLVTWLLQLCHCGIKGGTSNWSCGLLNIRPPHWGFLYE
jgi:hypothetical protein